MLLQAEHISKSFGATQALRDVCISLEAGKVQALVGENGAGKSTLFKICSGAIFPDEGRMVLDGRPYSPANMQQAQKQGVALVFQELTIIPSLSIAENIFIDRMHDYAGPLGLTNWRSLRRAAQAILDDIGASISVEQNLEELDLGQLKIVEIARALSYKPKVLFLDESTAFLSTQEIRALFDVIATLKKQGIAIGYISHHLEEIDAIADTITILKDGNWVGVFDAGELHNDEIEARMVGREIGHAIYPPRVNPIDTHQEVLQLRGIRVDGTLDSTDLSLHRGEIMGIAGLKGSGGENLLSVINGDVSASSGEMLLRGERYRPRRPSDAWKHRIAYMPGDRGREGIIPDFSVRTNLSMSSIPHRGPFVDHAAETQLVQGLVSTLQIKTASAEAPCVSLSGGNLQKVVLGKCLAPEPQILLLNNPTRGIDVGARMEIYGVIRQMAESGVSVLLVSEDLPELIGMSDRILVMRKGQISHVFQHGESFTEEEIIRYMI